MPGVLIIEALAQARRAPPRLVKFDPDKQVIYFMAIDKAKFRKPVVPAGIPPAPRSCRYARVGPIWKMRGEAKVGDVVITEAEVHGQRYSPGLPPRRQRAARAQS